MSKEFGSCCNDLREAIAAPPNSFFITNEKGILYLTVGFAQTDRGPGWFDQAVLFCPFCGAPLQTKEEIAKKAHSNG